MRLQLYNVTKTYNAKIAVNNINITLKEGIYGFLGANGSGKSTTMRMICGLLKPTKGEIEINGKNIYKMDEQFRDILGYLPQDFGYYPEFSAKEFMIYMATLKGVSKSESNVIVKSLLDEVGLSNVANKKIGTFSGGMKQRLGIAQAILNNPKILVLDEPTAGLDPKERIRFRNLISSLSKDKIIILSTHIVSDIEYIADTILMLKQGNLIHSGSVNELTCSIANNVWECEVSIKESDELYLKYAVVNINNKDDNVVMRIVSDYKPTGNARLVKPTLEDLYLYHFKDEF
ncbi:MAG: ABC transporter ATP-binding protein [Filifactoraceae bacterium]